MNTESVTTIDQTPSLVRTLNIIYALHALGLALGAFGAASVIGSFLFGWPSIIAVIVAYIYRGDAKGTWMESHFDWTIRTFWIALVFAAVVAVLGLLLAIVVVGVGIWIVGMALLGIWAIYRIARGWLRLSNREAMPV